MNALAQNHRYHSSDARYWNIVAAGYPSNLSLLYSTKKIFDRALVDDWLPMLDTNAPWSMLDAGCGKGGDVGYFAFRGFDQVVGIDYSRKMLEEARAGIHQYQAPWEEARIHLHEMDLQSLWLPGSHFTVVCSFSSIDHIPTREGRAAAIRGLVDVMAENGLLVLTFPNTWAIGSLLKERRLLHVSPRSIGGRDVVCVEDRQSSGQLDYEFEQTCSWEDLERHIAECDHSLSQLEIRSGVMTEMVVARSEAEVARLGRLPDGCEILLDLVRTPAGRHAVDESIDQWSAVPVERRGLRIGMVAQRR